MQIDVGDYPSKQQVVEFAVWMSMYRERVRVPGAACRLGAETDGEGETYRAQHAD